VELEIETVADGLGYPEGPVPMRDGSVLVVELTGTALTRVLPGGAAEVIARLDGGPNGVALGPDGAAYVCNNGAALLFPTFDGGDDTVRPNPDYTGGWIERVDLRTGSVTRLYDSCDGVPLEAPNDIVFDRTGGFWFTCFGWSDGRTRHTGGVYYARPDGSHLSAQRIDQITPNGIALSADERTLYWSDSMLQKLWAAEIVRPGELAPAPAGPAPGQAVATLPGMQWPDSMAMEADGRVCIATIFSGVVAIVDARTGSFEEVAFPDPITTNVALGGADRRDGWATGSARGELYRCRWPRPGLPLNFEA
jgi:gluconolactonase